MMVSANAQAKPRSTGRETKAPRNSARNTQASNKSTPVRMTSAKPIGMPPTATAEAKIAAADEVGETMAKRLLPNQGYRHSPTSAASSACAGGTLAMAA